jgi:hypothetical protein
MKVERYRSWIVPCVPGKLTALRLHQGSRTTSSVAAPDPANSPVISLDGDGPTVLRSPRAPQFNADAGSRHTYGGSALPG